MLYFKFTKFHDLENCFNRRGIMILGHPEPPEHCRVHNISTEHLSVRCEPGFNGGLYQIFKLSLIDSNNHQEIVTYNNTIPVFFAENLQPESDLILHITAENRKGKSRIVKLFASTLKAPKKQMISK